MFKKWILVLTGMLLFLCMGFGERKGVTLSIPLTSEGNGGSYTYQMTEGNRVVDTVTVSHEQERYWNGVLSVSLSEPGTYHYQIEEQGKGPVYEVSVYVSIDATGNLIGEPILYRAGESAKLDACSFEQKVAIPTEPAPEQPASPVVIPTDSAPEELSRPALSNDPLPERPKRTKPSEQLGVMIPDEEVPLGMVFTGDMVPILLFFILFAGSGIVLLVVSIWRKRGKS